MALAIWALAGGGCATRIPERDRGMAVQGHGAASQLVFHTAHVHSRITRARTPAWELSRRDARLVGLAPEGMASRSVTTALDHWPTRRIPSLDNARRLYLGTTARSIMYLNQRGQYEYRRDYEHHHGGYFYERWPY